MPIRSSPPLVLAADIGGTHTRLALFAPGRRRPRRLRLATYASREAPRLEPLLEDFRAGLPAPPAAACLALAGPVEGGACRLTNLPWPIVSAERLRRRFGWPVVRLANDLEALARAVPLLASGETRSLGGGRGRRMGVVGVLAPGTGLGMALLDFPRGRPRALPSEGGHAGLAPQGPEEAALWEFLHRRHGHVSLERVLSGPGLTVVYDWICATDGVPAARRVRPAAGEPDAAAAIAREGVSGRDPHCRRAVDRFARLLGSAAGNLALTGRTTGGIYLGGGAAAALLPRLAAGGFREAFEAKGPQAAWLRRVPVRVILHPRAGLLGAAALALEALGDG